MYTHGKHRSKRLVDTTETTSGAAKIFGRDTRDSHRTGRDPGARVMTTCDMGQHLDFDCR